MSETAAADSRLAPGPVFIHATAVAIAEAGVLIRGASGAGKSRLALALIAAAEGGACFARLVGDDRIRLQNSGGRLIASGHPRIEGQIELRGQGILSVPVLTAAVVRLLIDLVPAAEGPPRYPEPECGRAICEGVELDHLTLRQESAWGDRALAILHRLGWSRRSLSRHMLDP